eukprot:15464149-Alexandrium_andersonii.AAC.1
MASARTTASTISEVAPVALSLAKNSSGVPVGLENAYRRSTEKTFSKYKKTTPADMDRSFA